MIKYLKILFFCGPRIIFAYFSWILRYSMHPERYSIEKKFYKTQKLIRYVLKKFNVKYLIYNCDELLNYSYNKSRLIICNHLSDIDPLIFIALSKKPLTFAAKVEVKKMPFVGRVVTLLGGKFLNRDDLKQQLRVMKEIEQDMTCYPNLDWVIFPEGTRNKEPLKGPIQFHHGTFRPAFKTNSDIYVTALYGTFRILKIDNKFKFYPVELAYIFKFTKDDYQNSSTSLIANKSYELIKNKLYELRELDSSKIKMN